MPPSSLFHLILCLTLLLSVARGQRGVLLGSLSPSTPALSGSVFAISDRVIQIRNFIFLSTDPPTYLSADRGSSATRSGLLLRERPDCKATSLTAYGNATVIFELPAGETLMHIGYISIWSHLTSSALAGLSISHDVVLALPDGSHGLRCPPLAAEPFPVAVNMNCEPLIQDSLQVRWRVDVDRLVIELIARVSRGQYVAFGPAGPTSDAITLGADPAVIYQASNGSFRSVDYYVSAPRPCFRGNGACPDDGLSKPGTDNVIFLSAARELDLLRVTFYRPMRATDETADREIRVDGPTAVLWGIGNLSQDSRLPTDVASNLAPAGEALSLEFGRARRNNCGHLLLSSQDDSVKSPIKPSKDREPILAKQDTDTIARIGPSGRSRGSAAFIVGLNISLAWYMDDILATAIGVERGKTYTFRVYGGIKTNEANPYHPLYITSDEQGGFFSKSASEQEMEKVWVEPVEGALCEYKEREKSVDDTESFKEYFESLDRTCAKDPNITENGGILTWAVSDDTPNIVYYQSATNRGLGFKIRVFDEGKMNVEELRELNQNNMRSSCATVFKGKLRIFEGCRKKLTGNVSVYWNFNRAKNELETLFTGRPVEGGYVGWGWGSTAMIGSRAAVAYAGPNGTYARIKEYYLGGKNSESVQVDNRKMFKSSSVEVTPDGVVMGLFVRDLDGSVTFGITSAIWAVGPTMPSVNTLKRHVTHGSSKIDLSMPFIGFVRPESEKSTGKKIQMVFIVHGAMMGLSWLVLAPLSILVMRYMKRFNPFTLHLHRALLIVAVFAAMASYTMALISASRTEVIHLVVGSVVMGLCVLQVFGGIFRPENGTLRRQKFRKLHLWGGRVTAMLGVVNMYIGLFIIQATWWLYLVVSVGVGVWVTLFLMFTLALSKRFPVGEEDEKGNNDDDTDTDWI